MPLNIITISMWRRSIRHHSSSIHLNRFNCTCWKSNSKFNIPKKMNVVIHLAIQRLMRTHIFIKQYELISIIIHKQSTRELGENKCHFSFTILYQFFFSILEAHLYVNLLRLMEKFLHSLRLRIQEMNIWNDNCLLIIVLSIQLYFFQIKLSICYLLFDYHSHRHNKHRFSYSNNIYLNNLLNKFSLLF